MGKKNIKKRFVLNAPIKTVLGIIIPCFIGISVSLILSILFSYILSNSSEISEFISLYFIISVLSGAFICGFTGSKLLNLKGLFSGLICSIPFSLCTFLIMFIKSDNQLSISALILFLIILIISTVGGIVSSNMKRRK